MKKWWCDIWANKLYFTVATKSNGEKVYRDERGVIVTQTPETEELNKCKR